MNLRIFRLSALALLAGCATAAAGGAPADTPGRVITAGDSYDFRIANDASADALPIRATPVAAWTALPGVYQALDIPVEHIDAAGRILGNQRHQARRRLGGEPMSTWFTCGSTLSGPIANEYDLRIAVLSQVRPAEEPSASILSTRVEATARSRDGTSASEVACSTTGRLERRIAELLNRSIGG